MSTNPRHFFLQGIVDALLHRFTLATGPAVVLGQVGQAGRGGLGAAAVRAAVGPSRLQQPGPDGVQAQVEHLIARGTATPDYEAELVAVIGAGGKHIAAADAPAAIFGYTVGNDVTERMWQHASPQWSLGKSFDTHAPMGPWIVTADELGDPHDLGIRCFVNGEERQNSNTQHLVYNVWQQVEHLSVGMTLEPGDCLFTGTPGGVGAAMDPRQFLQIGDIVRCEIDGLGHIEGTMVAEG